MPIKEKTKSKKEEEKVEAPAEPKVEQPAESGRKTFFFPSKLKSVKANSLTEALTKVEDK